MVHFYSEKDLQDKHDEVFQSCTPSPDILPPGSSEAEFKAALREFTKILGEEHVLVGKDLINFRDPYPLDQDAHHASAAVL